MREIRVCSQKSINYYDFGIENGVMKIKSV